MIISKTPYRISFFGGGSDYPEWYLRNGGRVITTTINKYIYISCRTLNILNINIEFVTQKLN
jgi:D-glycero-alpha-D-manno-heptose-7-phosphate kinase